MAESERSEQITDEEGLRFVMEREAKRPLSGDFARLFKLLSSVYSRLTPALVKQLDVLARIADGGRRLSDHGLCDDVACFAVGVGERYRDEIVANARAWRGPTTTLKRAILEAFPEEKP